VLLCVTAAPHSLLVSESSDIVTCPLAPAMPPDREGLRSHYVSRGFRPASRCGRALVSLRASSGVATCHRARHPTGKGSGVVMCPAAPEHLLV
jgi:hypothetical protein